jgi:hypothetical protein
MRAMISGIVRSTGAHTAGQVRIGITGGTCRWPGAAGAIRPALTDPNSTRNPRPPVVAFAEEFDLDVIVDNNSVRGICYHCQAVVSVRSVAGLATRMAESGPGLAVRCKGVCVGFAPS